MAFLGKLFRRVRAGAQRSPLNDSDFAASQPITVTSPAFTDGGTMPKSSAGKGVGDNASPALQWAGLPAMTVPDATRVFTEGDAGTFDLSEGTWRNDTTGASGTVPRPPGLILDIIESGGVMPRLAAQGYLPAELGDLLRSSAVAMRGAGSGA